MSAQEETVGDLPIDWSVNQTDTQDTEIGSGSDGSIGDVILIIVFTTIPIALLTFVLGAKNALDQVGKGQF